MNAIPHATAHALPHGELSAICSASVDAKISEVKGPEVKGPDLTSPDLIFLGSSRVVRDGDQASNDTHVTRERSTLDGWTASRHA